MKVVMEDYPEDSYRILYIHQQDTREFNRGAMKNIGFIAVKNMYPNNYKDITLVFNDIDTLPYTKNFLDYKTNQGRIKHFYGFTFALGGIVSVTGADFEKLNGFPNFWAWGYEDNMLNFRANEANIFIDRSQFYPIMDKNIFQLVDGLKRNINRTEYDTFLSKTKEGINTIYNIHYNIDEETGFVNVTDFKTNREENLSTKREFDIRNGGIAFPERVNKVRRRGRMGMII